MLSSELLRAAPGTGAEGLCKVLSDHPVHLDESSILGF